MGQETSETITSLEGIKNVPEKWVKFFELAFDSKIPVSLDGWGNNGYWEEWLVIAGVSICRISYWDGENYADDEEKRQIL